FLYNEGSQEAGKEWLAKATGKEVEVRKLFIQLQIAHQENNKEEVNSLLTEIGNRHLPSPLACIFYEWKAFFNETENQYDAAVDNYRIACQYAAGGFAYHRITLMHYHQLVTNPMPAEECLKNFEKAVRYGNFDTIQSLWYLYGKSGREFQNTDRGLYWLEKGVLYNQGYAANELGTYLLENNPEKAETGMDYLDKAMELKFPEAYLTKAWYYFKGDMLEKNISKAQELLQKGMELGSGNAAYQLGNLYEQGIGTENDTPDYVKALEYYEKAAELGYLPGYERCGLYYLNGYAGEADMEKCLSYYEKGSSHGSPYCKVELGLLYLNGNGVEENEETAFTLFQEAAETEYIAGYYFLGRCYKYKWGTEENPDKAFELFEKAAKEEHIQAMAELALCYEHGYGTEESGRKALLYMKKAAEKEYAYAQYKVGCYYMYGLEGILRNYDEAFNWLSKAVENEYPYAYLELGDYYFYDYTNRDEEEKAYSLYQKAAQQGILMRD
ncbi:MAG: hypothetical protein LIP01_06040, partial [Tannerellaceae bacterium]|nr:hypothetical protein [Tannerellaceae bacterium]